MSHSHMDLVVPDGNDDVPEESSPLPKSWKGVVLVPKDEKNADLVAEDTQKGIDGSLPFALMHEG